MGYVGLYPILFYLFCILLIITYYYLFGLRLLLYYILLLSLLLVLNQDSIGFVRLFLMYYLCSTQVSLLLGLFVQWLAGGL